MVCAAEGQVAFVYNQFGYVWTAGRHQVHSWNAHHSPVNQLSWFGNELWGISKSVEGNKLLHGSPSDLAPVALPLSHIEYDITVAGCSKNKYLVYQTDRSIHIDYLNASWESQSINVKLLGESLRSKLTFPVQFIPIPQSCYLRIDDTDQTVVIKLSPTDWTLSYQGPLAKHVELGLSGQLIVTYPTHIVRVDLQSVDAEKEDILYRAQEEPAFGTLLRTYSNSKGTLVQYTSDNLVFIENRQIVWKRHEALSKIKQSMILDYPAPHSWEETEELVTNPWTRFWDRWNKHISMIFGETKLQNTSFTNFGVRKLLLFLVDQHWIYAVDSAQGEIVWVNQMQDTIDHMHLIHPTIGSEPALVSLLGSKGKYTLNPFTGELATGTKILSPMEVALDAHLPTNPSFSHIYKLEVNQGLLRGFEVVSNSQLISTYNWTLSGKCLGVAAIDKTQRTASLGRVRGDRTVYFKYLNPNVIAIASQTPADTLAVDIIDAATGSILTTFTQSDVNFQLPVHLARVDQWVIVVYWNQGSQGALGWTLSVIEMFALDRATARPQSAFAFPIPQFMTATYSLPLREIIVSIGVTTTRHGVALRDLILVTEKSIYTVSRQQLDALRPNAAPGDVDLPYNVMLALDDRRTLSHHRHLMVHQVTTASTDLESTSVILAWGGDVFWTRTHPSGHFDQLSLRFPKQMLVLTCSSLAIACLISRYLVRSPPIAFSFRLQTSARWVDKFSRVSTYSSCLNFLCSFVENCSPRNGAKWTP
jgi:hypothetical protein